MFLYSTDLVQLLQQESSLRLTFIYRIPRLLVMFSDYISRAIISNNCSVCVKERFLALNGMKNR